ncbi:MAG: macro domain-containing protein [Acidobacteriota bacterium]|nr:macro domain-containing protein [Acidobacteriota bacterium]MDW3228687.1 macro domain-containing protein [Acidobacteriota bacterium]MDY0231508.1 macro domain-containing protein [Candidatus Saccharicenans sp.]
MRKEISGVIIECLKGNIADQPDIMAVVNAANAHLQPGGGVAGAIHRAAGPGLEEECRQLAPIEPGQAVMTRGHNLPNPYVIHCLGPVYGVDKPEEKLLADCYRNSLMLAEQHEIDSIAFPAISTGFFRYPLEKATRVALKTVLEMAPQLKKVKKIRFVLFNDSDLEVYEAELTHLAGS